MYERGSLRRNDLVLLLFLLPADCPYSTRKSAGKFTSKKETQRLFFHTEPVDVPNKVLLHIHISLSLFKGETNANTHGFEIYPLALNLHLLKTLFEFALFIGATMTK